MAKPTVIIVGAGIGALVTSIRLARYGYQVKVYEARSQPGGFAGGENLRSTRFDSGPFLLLDLPSLTWVFDKLHCDIRGALSFQRVERVSQVIQKEGPPIPFYYSLERTAKYLERQWPGVGDRYVGFVQKMGNHYKALEPIQRVATPTLTTFLRHRALGGAWFLRRRLPAVFRRWRFPKPLCNAIGVWAHLAGHNPSAAPSLFALMAHLIHGQGVYFPKGGFRSISKFLYQTAKGHGVVFRFDCPVKELTCHWKRVTGVRLLSGETEKADAVVVNRSAVGTYLSIADQLPHYFVRKLEKLPLQSPGVSAYLKVKATPASFYLNFALSAKDSLCRLMVRPSVLEGSANSDWESVRVLSPMEYSLSQENEGVHQRGYLEKFLLGEWWQGGVQDYQVLKTRLPREWGDEFFLHAESGHPLVSRELMFSGRLRHKSPFIDRLYFAGSSTHPGPWVSGCAISGILAADCLRKDIRLR